MKPFDKGGKLHVQLRSGPIVTDQQTRYSPRLQECQLSRIIPSHDVVLQWNVEQHAVDLRRIDLPPEPLIILVRKNARADRIVKILFKDCIVCWIIYQRANYRKL